MLEYKKYTFERKEKDNQQTMIFDRIKQFNGNNIREIINLIKRAGIPKIVVRQSDLMTKKESAHFIRIQGGLDSDYISLAEGDWVGTRFFEIHVFSDDYIKQYYTIKKNKLIRKG